MTNKMHLYKFNTDDGEIIISAAAPLKAIEIYKAETGKTFVSTLSHITDGKPQMTPNQLYGNIIFSFCGDLPMDLPDTFTGGTNDESCAVADADAWAVHWPNQVVEFDQMWGEQ